MIDVIIVRYTVIGILFMQAAAAGATETITYTYDAVGRLVATAHSGDVNTNLSSAYQYDAADNRSQVTVNTDTTMPGGGSGGNPGRPKPTGPKPPKK